MAKKNKVMKWIIIITFAVFIISTLLTWILQFFDMSNNIQDPSLSWENLTWTEIQTWLNLSWESLDLTWDMLTWESN